MITPIAFPLPYNTGNATTRNQKPVLYLAMFLLLCFFSISSFAQPKGSKPDPSNTYGEGSSIKTTQSINPDSFIPETKTEYFDENDVLREEVIETKDFDGNKVTIKKKYDKTGKPESRHELRKDEKNNTVYEEEMYYDENGKVRNANKWILENGKRYYFSFDKIKQTYKEGVPFGYVKPDKPKAQFACNCSKTEVKIGYSYMQTGNSGISGTLPTGAEISMGRRLGSHTQLILDVNGHRSRQSFQTLSRLNLQAGIEYDINKCDDDDNNFVIYSRIAIGITIEGKKTKIITSSATAPSGTLGLGADIKLFRKTSLYLSADWAPSYFNKTLQNNFQAGAGLAFRFGSK